MKVGGRDTEALLDSESAITLIRPEGLTILGLLPNPLRDLGAVTGPGSGNPGSLPGFSGVGDAPMRGAISLQEGTVTGGYKGQG